MMDSWAQNSDLSSVSFFFQAEDGIRDAQESRGLGDVYKRQNIHSQSRHTLNLCLHDVSCHHPAYPGRCAGQDHVCLLYTSDAADDLLCVDLGGRRIIKQKFYQTDITLI